jgi:hypothetical protein
MFDHQNFDVYRFDEVPLDRDTYLMDELYLDEYENHMLRVFEGSREHPVGYISYAAVRAIADTALEISWYPNIYDRFHEVTVTLPRSEFVTCVGSSRWDEKPRIFVKRGWLDALHLKNYSVFGFIDAIGVKKAFQRRAITRDHLVALRDSIDELGKSYPQVSFISFADSVLVKSNWSVGHVESTVQYTYQPEVFFAVLKELQDIFQKTLGLSVYAVLTQGQNEYYDDALLHISGTQNHVCLNSLGVPFAQLLAIDAAARENIRHSRHPHADVYMDERFFRSVRFKFGFTSGERAERKYSYCDKMSDAPGFYYPARLQEILTNLDSPSS